MTFTPRPLRAGILGDGLPAALHARSIRAAGGHVVAVNGGNLERTRSAQEQIGAEHGLNSMDQFLGRDDIDVVHVCGADPAQQEYATRALEAGKWVVCGRPMATTGPAAMSVVIAAERAGRVGTIPFVHRYHPKVRQLRQRIARGDLGPHRIIRTSSPHDCPASRGRTDDGDVRTRAGLPPTTVADIGTDWFDLLEFVTGERVVHLSAHSTTTAIQNADRLGTTEDALSVHFTTATGTSGEMVLTQDAAGCRQRGRLKISDPAARFVDHDARAEKTIVDVSSRDQRRSRIHHEDGISGICSDTTASACSSPRHPLRHQGAHDAFVRDSYRFFACMIFGSTIPGDVLVDLPRLLDGLRAAQLSDAMRRSVGNHSAWTSTSGPA